MSARMLAPGPVGPIGTASRAVIVDDAAMSLVVEVLPTGLALSFGNGEEEGQDDVCAVLTEEGARLMMDACAAYLDLIATPDTKAARHE